MTQTRSKGTDRLRPARRSWSRRAGLLAAMAAALLAALAGPAFASTTDPYLAGTSGFDVSYPNCGASLPTGDTFAIVGVGDGRPFTTYTCVGAEWSAAENATSATPSLYFNTGYAGAYGHDIETACTNEVGSAGVFGSLRGHALTQAQQAWEIGCSEAYYAYTKEPGTPTTWWADVETGNSWSTNTSLNQYAIDGISYQMQQPLLGGGGIYSSPTMWARITGSATWAPTPPVPGNWVTGTGGCTSTFGGVANWVAQGSAVNGIDSDTACP
ncbi:MAG: hypothetical protein ACYCO3_05980 [Mycobacteriales bacterium]